MHYQLAYLKPQRHDGSARFTFHIRTKQLDKRSDIDRFIYFVARWCAINLDGDFRIHRFLTNPIFAISDRKDYQKFYQHWNNMANTSKKRVIACRFT